MSQAGGLGTGSGVGAVTSVSGTSPIQANGVSGVPQTGAVTVSIVNATTTTVGVASFNAAEFTVSGAGAVSLIGGSEAIDSIGVDASSGTGTNPVLPNAAGLLTVTGAQVASGTIGANVIRTDSTTANTYTVEIQRSATSGSADSTLNGVSHFNAADFSVDADGFVSAQGSGILQTLTGNSGGARSPTAGNINILGSTVVAGTTPVTVAGAASTLTINLQRSQALAATDATKIGLCNFDSARFTVDANGFVTLNGSGAAETITGDSGGALSPTAGNWGIVGLSGSKTSGSGSTLTIKSPPLSQVGASATSSLNTGEFITAAVTRTLPASAGLADGDLFIYVCTTAGALVIQSVTAQKIRIGSLISAAAGTATSTAIGDSLTLRFNATDGFFYAVSVVGTWLVV